MKQDLDQQKTQGRGCVEFAGKALVQIVLSGIRNQNPMEGIF